MGEDLFSQCGKIYFVSLLGTAHHDRKVQTVGIWIGLCHTTHNHKEKKKMKACGELAFSSFTQ